jgi:hypothetical protein
MLPSFAVVGSYAELRLGINLGHRMPGISNWRFVVYDTSEPYGSYEDGE